MKIRGDTLSKSDFGKVKYFIKALTGSRRYGFPTESSDFDFALLTNNTSGTYCDFENRTDYFIYDLNYQYGHWADLLLIGNLTSPKIEGDRKIIQYLNSVHSMLPYTYPLKSFEFGMSKIILGETKNPRLQKQSARLAILIKHLSEEYPDPFLFSSEETQIYHDFRNQRYSSKDRIIFYKKHLSQKVIHKLTMMPTHLELRDEYFSLLKELGYCDRVFPFSNKRS